MTKGAESETYFELIGATAGLEPAQPRVDELSFQLRLSPPSGVWALGQNCSTTLLVVVSLLLNLIAGGFGLAKGLFRCQLEASFCGVLLPVL